MDKSAEEVKEHFTKHAFGIQSEGIDPTILEGMKQRDVAWELDAEPTDKEIDASIKQAKAGKSTVDGIYMDYYKAMEEHGTGRAANDQAILHEPQGLSGDRPRGRGRAVHDRRQAGL